MSIKKIIPATLAAFLISYGSANAANIYVTNKGDTLDKIAKENNLTLQQLKTWNSVGSEGTVYPGQKIITSDPRPKPSNPIQIPKPTKPYKPAKVYNPVQVSKPSQIPKPVQPSQPVVPEVKKSSSTIENVVQPNEETAIVSEFAHRKTSDENYTYKTKMNGKEAYVNPGQVGTKSTNNGIIYPFGALKIIDEEAGNADGKITSDEIKKYSKKSNCPNCKKSAEYILSDRKEVLDVQYTDEILTSLKQAKDKYESKKSSQTAVVAAKPAKEKKNKEYKEPKEGGLEASIGIGIIGGTPFLDVDAVVLRGGDYSLEINGIYGGRNSGPSTIITDGNADPITGFYSHGEKTTSSNENICGYGAMVYKKLKAFSIGAGVTNYNINACEDVSTIEQIRRGTNVLAEKTNAYSTISSSIEPKLTLGAKFGSTKEGVKAKVYVGNGNPALSVQYYRKFGKK